MASHGPLRCRRTRQAKPRQPHPDLAEQRRDRMIPIVLHMANLATASAIRSPNGVLPGLRGNDLLLESRQQPLPFGQGQPQMGDLKQIIGPGDRRDVDELLLTVSLGFYQPHTPSHALTSDPRSNTKLSPRCPHPQSPGSPIFLAATGDTGIDRDRLADLIKD